MKRSIIARFVGIAITLGLGSGIADASVKHCGPGMVLDTQAGVSACKPMPVTPGHHGHRALAHAISQWPN